ncbi:hypothetical protein IAD21_00547 [Abditibacteriota bacterium]|nr:hypothetical protein IAD21_00547 [Abditibacteriota bacterium]
MNNSTPIDGEPLRPSGAMPDYQEELTLASSLAEGFRQMLAPLEKGRRIIEEVRCYDKEVT